MKTEIREHILRDDTVGDFDQEEIDNTLKILDDYDEDMKGLASVDAAIIGRMVGDVDLLNQLDALLPESPSGNPFDDS